jgi:regulator of protease activity HflC (stomatin/prohibitin superfamily)
MFELYTIIIIVVALVSATIRIVNQYERGVVFTLGKFTGMLEPGLNFVIPFIQSVEKIDIRIKAEAVPDQNAITKDNVTVTVNAVLYYKISDASKAVIEVENYKYAISQYAQTTMRNIVGEVTLDELLSGRDRIADRIRETLGSEVEAWGIKVHNVELKDVSLPENMERTIAKQAEAEREKRAVIITSEGELAASENLSKAAQMLSSTPGALHLRTLQSINDMSSDQSNTVVYMVPVEALKALEGFGNLANIMKK